MRRIDARRWSVVSPEESTEGTVSQVDVGFLRAGCAAPDELTLESWRLGMSGVRARWLMTCPASEATHDSATQPASDPSLTTIRLAEPLSPVQERNRLLGVTAAPLLILADRAIQLDPVEGTIGKLLQFMRKHPDCGVCSCRVYYADGSSAATPRHFETLMTRAARELRVRNPFRQALTDDCYGEFDSHENFPCEWLAGNIWVLRRTAWTAVGEFDDQLTGDAALADYCVRMSVAGWRVMYCGETFCYSTATPRVASVWSSTARQQVLSYWRFLSKWGFRPGKHTAAGLLDPGPQRLLRELNRAA